jgi:hypothetical protein
MTDNIAVPTAIMEHQKAVVVLKELLEKRPLSDEEKEAVLAAIGLLSWAALGKTRMKALKEKGEKAGDY